MRDLWRRRDRQQRHLRGQTLVEFALVLPLLLVLFLGIADFGRAFAAGITLEAAARDAAEVAAEQYRRQPPDGQYADQTQPAPAPGDVAYYTALHEVAARIACREAGGLDNSTFDSVTDQCDPNPSGEQLPLIMVCVHDNADPICDQPAFGAPIPGPSDPDPCGLRSPPTNEMVGWTQATENSRYIEVRICYRFSMLIDTAFLPLDDIWLRKNRVFTVAYFPPPPTPSPPPPPSAPPVETIEPTPTPAETPTPSPTPEDTPTPTPEETPPDTPTPTPADTPAP